MNIDGSLGPLLQGVSQQPPAIRQEGKLTEQVNLVSDVVLGLTSRPPVMHSRSVAGMPAGLRFQDIVIDGAPYEIGYAPGYLSVWDEFGNPKTVTFDDAAAQAYVGVDMRGYVYDSVLYMTNRDTVVLASTVLPAENTLKNSGIIVSLGGLFSRTYSVALRYGDGVTARASYTAPDGTLAGDAGRATSVYIAIKLRDSLLAQPEIRAGTTVGVPPSVGAILIHATEAFSLTVDDGEDGTSLRACTYIVRSAEDLPATAPHGFLAKVVGDNGSADDDYFLRFNNSVVQTIGGGFGHAGVWEEWFNPAEVCSFDLRTMPHVLRKSGAGFAFGRGAWQPRRVGDSHTNPFQSIVGNTIRDIGGFQSRLVFASGQWAVMSRTNLPTDFFKQSALAEVATDPIGISSTQEGATRLDWIIPFDSDLVLMSDPGAGQFIIAGGGGLTPANASMVMTTAFEMFGAARPTQTGRTILFPFKSGKYSGINEFFTNADVTTNGAKALTETLDRYILGTVNLMQCSTNLNMVLLRTDGASMSNTVWVYKYLWSGSDKLQSAWSKWVFHLPVCHFFIVGSEVTLVFYDAVRAEYSLGTMNLDSPANLSTGYSVCLDNQRTVTMAGTYVDLPFSNAAFCQSTGCPSVGMDADIKTVVSLGSGVWRYSFAPGYIPVGASLIAGVRFHRYATPTMPFIRDTQGNIRPRAELVVTDFYVTYRDCGYLECTLTSPYRPSFTLTASWVIVDNDPLDPDGTGLRSGVFNMPWGERSDWSQLTVGSSDIRPTTLLEVQWSGQPFKP